MGLYFTILNVKTIINERRRVIKEDYAIRYYSNLRRMILSWEVKYEN